MAAERDVLAMFDGLTPSLFWINALLIVPKTPLVGAIVFGVNECCGAVKIREIGGGYW